MPRPALPGRERRAWLGKNRTRAEQCSALRETFGVECRRDYIQTCPSRQQLVGPNLIFETVLSGANARRTTGRAPGITGRAGFNSWTRASAVAQKNPSCPNRRAASQTLWLANAGGNTWQSRKARVRVPVGRTPKGVRAAFSPLSSSASHFGQRMPGELHGADGCRFESGRDRASDGVAQLDRASALFPNPCRCPLLCDECRWNYMPVTHAVAGSNPASGSKRRSSSVVEHVNVSSFLSSQSFCSGGPVGWRKKLNEYEHRPA